MRNFLRFLDKFLICQALRSNKPNECVTEQVIVVTVVVAERELVQIDWAQVHDYDR